MLIFLARSLLPMVVIGPSAVNQVFLVCVQSETMLFCLLPSDTLKNNS